MGQKTDGGCEVLRIREGHPPKGHHYAGSDGSVLYLNCDGRYIILHICQKSFTSMWYK